MSREEILTSIQGLAEKLGRVPTLTEIKTMTPVGRRAVRTHFGSYTEALIQCGMETGRRFRIPMETLFADWARVAREIQRIPSATDYEEKGLHSTRPLQSRCGSWRKVPHMMLKYAQEEGLVAQWPDVVAMARAEKELSWPATESLWPGHEAMRWDVFTNRPVYGTPMNMGPLAHAPTNEMGVVFLFGTVAKDLGYMVVRVQAEFPDCEVFRLIDPERCQLVLAEFEFESRNFLAHGHRIDDCDLIICWKHNWEGCPLEVLELSKVIAEIGKRKNLTAD